MRHIMRGIFSQKLLVALLKPVNDIFIWEKRAMNNQVK
jgi:hypothetical protein